MIYLIQQLFIGLGIGSVYAALALALCFSFRATGIVNFGQGSMGAFSVYLGWSLLQIGLPTSLVFVSILIIAFLIGLVTYYLTITPVLNKPPDTAIAVTIGLFLFFLGITGTIWGFLIKPFPSVLPIKNIIIGDIILDGNSFVAILVVLVSTSALYWAFKHTKLGLLLRAVGLDKTNTQLLAIPVGFLLALGWSLASIFGALAAMLAAPIVFLHPNMMTNILVFALASAIVGSFTRVPIIMIASLAFGVLQALINGYLDRFATELSLFIPFLLVLVIMLFKPFGFGGATEQQRV